jgi:DNA modification methylase
MENLELFNFDGLDAIAPIERDDYIDQIRGTGLKTVEIDIGDITFLGGQSEPIHRWFRLTPSYSPNLVRFFLKHFNATKADLVFDPFSGRGTTGIECRIQGVDSLSVELNPLLQRVGEYSLDFSGGDFLLIDQFMLDLEKSILNHRSSSLEEVLSVTGLAVPDIHDVYRWWRLEVLKNLLLAKHLMEDKKYQSIYKVVWVNLNMASLECANIHRNHPTISFDDDSVREIDVLADICGRLTKAKNDLAENRERKFTSSNQIILGDSTELAKIVSKRNTLGKEPSMVITSPPYPNRFSYIHQTRPQLHFMEVIKSRGEATDLDVAAIGGTWGRATSMLMKDLIIPEDAFRELLPYFEELSKKSTLMCNYATKYFLDMDRHIASLKTVASENVRGAYVVGNSRLSGVEIHTECILARIFHRHGFRTPNIIVFRKRGGRRKLYETAVCFTAAP